MIAAVSEATVPKVSVIVRKAYGAGLYAMCGPAFEPEACIALPTASIAVMGEKAAVNAVYFNKLKDVPEGPEREALVEKLREEYRAEVDLPKLASELVVDAVVPFEDLRRETALRLRNAAGRSRPRIPRKHLVPPM
jgi:acetyl-CoA carboxylase carboxyltransferase component